MLQQIKYGQEVLKLFSVWVWKAFSSVLWLPGRPTVHSKVGTKGLRLYSPEMDTQNSCLKMENNLIKWLNLPGHETAIAMMPNSGPCLIESPQSFLLALIMSRSPCTLVLTQPHQHITTSVPWNKSQQGGWSPMHFRNQKSGMHQGDPFTRWLRMLLEGKGLGIIFPTVAVHSFTSSPKDHDKLPCLRGPSLGSN